MSPCLELPFNALPPGNIVSDPYEVTSQALVLFDRVSRFVQPSWRPWNVMRAEDPGGSRAKGSG